MRSVAPRHGARIMNLNRLRLTHAVAAGSLIALIFLCLGWELWWAPVRPGGSLLALKALPLLLPLFGTLRGSRYTNQWASMFILIYLAEGSVRAFSDHDLSRYLACVEIALSLTFFTSAVCYARLSASPRT